MKVCNGCQRTLPLGAFHREGDGHKTRCKPCLNAARRVRYRKDRTDIQPRGRPGERRFPFDPIEQHIRTNTRASLAPHGGGTTSDSVTNRQIAEQLQISTRSIFNYRHRGLSEHQADELAIQLGHHPLEFWPDYYTQEDAA